MCFLTTRSRGIKSVIMAAFLLLVSLSVARAGEEIRSTVATGVAVIKGGNIQGAREDAKNDALRQALEQGVDMLMDATSILQNDDLMEKIYTNTQGCVTSYEIIKEEERGGLYRVKIRAMVKTGALRDALVRLGLIKALMDYPRVLVLAFPGQRMTTGYKSAEAIIIKEFTDKRFDLVDPLKSRELYKEAEELFRVNTLENAAARIGLRHHAEIVVLCGLDEGRAEFDGIMESVPVSIRAKAIVTTTAQVLTAEDLTVQGMGKTPELALRDGARKAGEGVSRSLSQRILSWWTDYTANGLPYTIVLRTGSGADLLVIDFEKAVESIPGVLSLTERSSGGGITEMMVRYRMGSADLKREILTRLKGSPGFERLRTVVSKGRFMVFSIVPD